MKREVMIDHVVTLTETILGVVEGDVTEEEEDGYIGVEEEGASEGEEEEEGSVDFLHPQDMSADRVLQEIEKDTNIRRTEIAHLSLEDIQWVLSNRLLVLKGDLLHQC